MTRNSEILQNKINTLVDSQLLPDEQAAAMVQISQDPESLATLRAWQTQREALRSLHRPLLDETIPNTLLAAARRSQKEYQQLDQWWRWGGMAAAVMLAFGVGWFSKGQLGNSFGQQLASNKTPAMQTFIHQASLAHAVFSPEVRHPVEVTAAQQEHLVQWLSKRVGKPLKVPILTTQGYELVGGRLLPGDGGARAQFMFQNPAGLRVTLYLGAVESNPTVKTAKNDTTPKTDSQETAFRYSADGPVPSFYWVEQGFGYALSGPISREELMKLAQLVYQQL